MRSFLFVLPWIPDGTGGVDEAVFGLGGELKASSRFKPVIGVTSSSVITTPNEVRGIPIVGLKLHGHYDVTLRESLSWAAWLPSELAGLARVLRSHRVEIVNVHFPGLAGAAFFFLRRLGLYSGKIVLTFHGSDVARVTHSSSVAHRIWKHYISSADEVFACSRALAAQVRSLCPEKEPRVIYNGADIELFRGIARVQNSRHKRVLHIGRFEHKKSQDVLLAAFRMLLDRNLDCTLTMIGASGPTLERVRMAAAAFGDRVTVLVDVRHDLIPHYMADADLFVLPSRSEPFGIALIEAGAAGLPVVATNVGGIPEIITHAETGLLVEPDNPRELANAMATVLENQELAGSLALRLRAQALQFSWRRAADELVAALCLDPGRQPLNP